MLTVPHVGRVGEVGTVDVDVRTGEMANSPAGKDGIMQRARELVKTLPPYRHQTLPEKFMPKPHMRAPMMQLPDEV